MQWSRLHLRMRQKEQKERKTEETVKFQIRTMSHKDLVIPIAFKKKWYPTINGPSLTLIKECFAPTISLTFVNVQIYYSNMSKLKQAFPIAGENNEYSLYIRKGHIQELWNFDNYLISRIVKLGSLLDESYSWASGFSFVI